jgi:outer membrane receptor protein involved in Fe transport
MTIEDDIVSVILDDTRKTLNSGETRHQGVELTLMARWSERWSSSFAWSHSRQEYKDFSYICGTATCNFAGNDIPRAPDDMGNATLAYAAPDGGWRVELEWEYLGRYYTDETNTRDYGGHDLFNLRGQYRLSDTVEFYARVQNLADHRYSTYTSNQVGSPELEYRPGQPRTATVGVRLSF